MSFIAKSTLLLVWIGFFVCAPAASAYTTVLPSSLAPEVLSETVPTAFSPNELSVDDYVLEWEGKSIEGVELKLVPRSLIWVRVADVLSIPRAQVVVAAKDIEGGRVSHAEFHQGLARADSGEFGASLPVALISGKGNPIEVSILRHGQEFTGRLLITFKPKPDSALGKERVFYDPSCSRYGVHADGTAQSPQARGWAYVGCRLADAQNTSYRTASLELIVFWDGVGQTIHVGGAKTEASSQGVWPLRVRSFPGVVHLQAESKAGGDRLTLHYSAPEVLHRAALGMGIGPYTNIFYGNGDDTHTMSPILTLYGSYFITETSRMTMFDATTLGPHLTTDLGVYFNSESLRVLDRRLSMNLLLGAHIIGFRTQGQYYALFGAPQGFEINFTDAWIKAHNLTVGAFIYPNINGKSYYNVWLRFGSPKFFGEFNYIAWNERIGQDSISIQSRNVGICVGFPLARFF